MTPTYPCPQCDQPVAVQSAANCASCGFVLLVDGRYELWAHPNAPRLHYRSYLGLDTVKAERVWLKTPELAHESLSEFDYQGFQARSQLLAGLAKSIRGLPTPLVYLNNAGQRQFLIFPAPLGDTLIVRLRAQRPTVSQWTTLAHGLLITLSQLHACLPPVLHGNIAPQSIGFVDAWDWEPVFVDPECMIVHQAMHRFESPTIAPEALTLNPRHGNSGEISTQTDLAGLAGLLFYAATRTEPIFESNHALSARSAAQLAHLPNHAAELLITLMSPENPFKSAKQILGHPLFRKSPKVERKRAKATQDSDARLVLVAKNGRELAINIDTVVNKNLVASIAYDERNYWHRECQFELTCQDNAWYLIPNTGEHNDTLLNGHAVASKVRLTEGDIVGVGNAGKSIVITPLTVRRAT